MVRISAAAFAATATVAAITLPDAVSAHSAQSAQTPTPERLEQRRLFMAEGKRSLKDCANLDASRRLQERAVDRRAARAESIRAERSERRRLDLDTVLASSHKSNLTGLTADTNASELFGGDVKCILEPEVTQGPYYVNGELVRSDIREDHQGVDLYAEIQIIDVNTCEPVEGLYLDFWHCNATGVYSGIVASGNGDSSDTTNLDKTFLRGLTPTDEDGVASYTTIFPGHYTSRATHMHIIGTLLQNNTYSGGYASHVGQLFFDQDLISEVELTAPYSTNTQELTTNADDSILSEEAAEDFDPVFEYVLLGDSVSDGVLAWISVGVDMTRAQTITAAGTLTADGGVMADSTSTTTGGAGGMGGGSGMGGAFAGGSGMGGFSGSVGGPEGSVATAASGSSDTTQTSTAGAAGDTTTSASVGAEAADPSCNVRLRR